MINLKSFSARCSTRLSAIINPLIVCCNLSKMSYKILLEDREVGGPADFETAMSAAGLGKFNLILLLVAIPSGWASVFDTKTMAYVSPAAQCDLDLSLENKGLLNAITYIGILSSGFIWGILADTYGRKYLLVICYLLDAIFITIAGISQNFMMLLISKYIAGFVMNGPSAILISLLSEFHSSQHRARFFLIQGMFSNLANILLPLMAWLVFQHNLDVHLLPGLELHSWNFYILFCAVPSVISGFAHMALPESPKFLMSIGENEKALKVFQEVFAWNTGKPAEEYPIKSLVDESGKSDKLHNNNNAGVEIEGSTNDGGDKMTKDNNNFRDKWGNVLSLFCPPQIYIITLLSLIQMGFKLGLNALKNWLPQLFTVMNDYRTQHGGHDGDFCAMMEIMTPHQLNNRTTSATSSATTNCTVNYGSSSVYTNLMIVSSASMIGFLITGSLINTLGKKRLFVLLGTVSGGCGAAIYFAANTETVVILSTALTAVSAVNMVVFNVTVVELLPTRLRTMAISLTRMIGLVETIVGNVVFPHLLAMGCLPPFLFVGIVTIGCAFLALLLPKENTLD